jgi:phosphatidylglycerophosphate synthase
VTLASPPSASRAATDELLAGLRAGQWQPDAWARFLVSSARRSVQQAVRHPRALTEVTVLHAALALSAGSRGRRWVAVSWAMAAAHLGMLEDRSSLGAASVVTLLRANLPALGARAARHPALVRWLPALALASDLADGRVARRRGTVTAFGTHADSLADAAFWTWFTLRHEPSRPVRIFALAAWAAPVAVVTSASITRGQMTDPPRPEMLRPAAAMQVIVAVRAALRDASPPWTHRNGRALAGSGQVMSPR